MLYISLFFVRVDFFQDFDKKYRSLIMFIQTRVFVALAPLGVMFSNYVNAQ